jgi:hypothetical protein
MLLESKRPVAVEEPHFKVFPEFRGASYLRRYQIFLQKLVRERLYDAVTFLLSPREGLLDGRFTEPDPELSLLNLTTALMGRAMAAHGRASAESRAGDLGPT